MQRSSTTSRRACTRSSLQAVGRDALLLPLLRAFLLGTAAVADGLSAAGPTETEKGRSNLLFTIIDDLGSHDLGYQSQQLLTPHIDKLAAEAVLLKDYYVLPVCSPTRTSILSGLYPMRFGLQHQVIWSGAPAGLPTNITTIADYLSRGGYACHAIGECYLNSNQQQQQ